MSKSVKERQIVICVE